MATSIQQLKQNAAMPVKQSGSGTLAHFLNHNKQAIQSVLPKHMTPERMMRLMMNAVRATPKLMECSAESLFGATIHCSQMGLEPNTPLGHAYLIPFGNRRANTTEVQVIIGYKGLTELARRSGEINSIYAEAVHQNDKFDIRLGTDGDIQHSPCLDGDRGEVIAFYAVAKMKDGGHQFEFMSRSQVEAVRDGSQGYQSAIRFKKDHPWMSHFVEMGRKTVLRRLCKYLPVSIELATAVETDGRTEAGVGVDYGQVLQGEALPYQPSEEVPGDDAEATEEPAPQKTEQGEAPLFTADQLAQSAKVAKTTDELDEIQDLAGEFDGSDKAKITRAVNARREGLQPPAGNDETPPMPDPAQYNLE